MEGWVPPWEAEGIIGRMSRDESLVAMAEDNMFIIGQGPTPLLAPLHHNDCAEEPADESSALDDSVALGARVGKKRRIIGKRSDLIVRAKLVSAFFCILSKDPSCCFLSRLS